jgi:hypothetical protein
MKELRQGQEYNRSLKAAVLNRPCKRPFYPPRFQAVILVFMSCLQDGTYELNHPFDLNMYLDIVLKVVLHSAGSRKVIFSCFHPDICTMLVIKCDHSFYS